MPSEDTCCGCEPAQDQQLQQQQHASKALSSGQRAGAAGRGHGRGHSNGQQQWSAAAHAQINGQANGNGLTLSNGHNGLTNGQNAKRQNGLSGAQAAESPGRTEMTTEQRPSGHLVEAGGGGGAMGCRGVGVGRAEAFARSLHHKLRNLGGSQQGQAQGQALPLGPAPARSDSPEDESWSSAPSGASADLSARRTLSSSSVDSSSDYYDMDCQSPQEEVTSQELAGMMAGSANRDDLLQNGGGPQSPQSDCSSDYFDTDSFDQGSPTEPAEQQQGDVHNGALNGLANGGHKYKAGTPEAMSEVSQLGLDEAEDDDEEVQRPRTRRGTGPSLARLNFTKSSQTILQEGLIEQLKQGHDIPPELKNGLCPCPASSGPEETTAVPVAGSRGLAAMKQAAKALEALETPDSSSTPCDAKDIARDLAELRLNGFGAEPNPAEDFQGLNGNHGQDKDLGDADHEEEEEEEEEEDQRPRIRRCSSLKTGKTPPGTPGRKKIVRFADVLGLDLADVRTFLDEIPKVPTSAYSDLQDVDPQADAVAGLGVESCLSLPSGQLSLAFHSLAAPCPSADAFGVRPHVTRVLVPLFQQPGGAADFLERVRDRQVCMENAVVADAALLSIAGQVRVRNLDFHKTVHIRYTIDGWRNFADLQATYVPNSCDGFSDKFTFTLFAGHTMSVGQRLEMAVRFQCKGQQYWDNNNGANYCFQCLPPSSAPPPSSLQVTVPTLNSPHDDGWKFLF
ncbi:Glycogen-binding subunit 76A [Frankliniella fusca]|uniref:Glycogen-binding subunit 76A n=1 Tax=Frankliniella fusca TaxID=407009 RepID=A0AAE1H441_9NEOP|nr:Glycogen-binding subunit 76A [Frankliniella fusca]